MGIFGINLESSNQNAKPLNLKKDYKFMYENFVFSPQSQLYLILEKAEAIEALKFNFKVFKYGYPNDEVGLPAKIPGIKNYGMSEVFNSEWIKELKINNRSHPKHNDRFYADYKHYVVRYKDVTLEVIAKDYEIVELTEDQFFSLIKKEILNVSNDG